MTNNDLYNGLLRILRKERKGLAVSPDGFSDLLQIENLALFNEYCRLFEINQSVTDALRPFKTSDQLDLADDATTFSVYVALPSDYGRITGLETGITLEDFEWNNGNFDGTGEYDAEFDTDGTEIEGLQKDGADAAAYGVTDVLELTASTKYVCRVEITDESDEGDSDIFYIKAVYHTGDAYHDITTSTQLSEGTNYLTFTANATYTDTYIVLYSGIADTCNLSATFSLSEFPDDFVSVDIVTDEEWVFRRNDALTAPSSTYPIAKIVGDNLHVLPKETVNVILYYLKEPATPFFDYYTDANNNIQYLVVEGTHELTAGEVGRSDEAAGETVTSSTVELEWEDTEKIKILHRILAKMGVSMDEQLVAQYATSKENA